MFLNILLVKKIIVYFQLYFFIIYIKLRSFQLRGIFGEIRSYVLIMNPYE